MPNAFASEVFQYGYLNPGSGQPLQISYAKSDAFHATNSTAFFSVQWAPYVPISANCNPISNRERSLSTDGMDQHQGPIIGVPSTQVMLPFWLAMILLTVAVVYPLLVMVCGYLVVIRIVKSPVKEEEPVAPMDNNRGISYSSIPERV